MYQLRNKHFLLLPCSTVISPGTRVFVLTAALIIKDHMNISDPMGPPISSFSTSSSLQALVLRFVTHGRRDMDDKKQRYQNFKSIQAAACQFIPSLFSPR